MQATAVPGATALYDDADARQRAFATVLQEFHGTQTLTQEAATLLDECCLFALREFAAATLRVYAAYGGGRITLTDVESAVIQVLDRAQELCATQPTVAISTQGMKTFAITEGNRAAMDGQSTTGDLKLDVQVVAAHLSALFAGQDCEAKVPMYLTAVVEYLASEMLDLGGRAANAEVRQRAEQKAKAKKGAQEQKAAAAAALKLRAHTLDRRQVADAIARDGEMRALLAGMRGTHLARETKLKLDAPAAAALRAYPESPLAPPAATSSPPRPESPPCIDLRDACWDDWEQEL